MTETLSKEKEKEHYKEKGIYKEDEGKTPKKSFYREGGGIVQQTSRIEATTGIYKDSKHENVEESQRYTPKDQTEYKLAVTTGQSKEATIKQKQYEEDLKNYEIEVAKYEAEVEAFKATNIEIRPDEWVAQSEWQKVLDLDKSEHTNYAEIAKTQGIEAMNKAIETKYQADYAKYQVELANLQKNSIQLKSGEWVDKTEYNSVVNSVPASLSQVLYNQGTVAFNKAVEAYNKEQQAKFEGTHKQLKTGEWIWKSQYTELKAYDAENGTDYHSILYNYGVAEMQRVWNTKNIQMQNGDWMTITDWRALKTYDEANGTKYHRIAYTQGIAALKVKLDADQSVIDRNQRTITLLNKYTDNGNCTTGTLITAIYSGMSASRIKEVLPQQTTEIDQARSVATKLTNTLTNLQAGKLPTGQTGKSYFILLGRVESFLTKSEKEALRKFEVAHLRDIENPAVMLPELARIIKAKPLSEQVIILNDINNITVDVKKLIMSDMPNLGKIWDSITAVQSKRLVTIDEVRTPTLYTGKTFTQVTWESVTPWHEASGQTYSDWAKRAKAVSIQTAEFLVPVVYTVRNWNNIPSWEKAVSVGVDILSIAPIIGQAGKGARTVSVAGKAGTEARLATAGKYAGREAIRQIFWPVELAQTVGKTVKLGAGIGSVKTVSKSGKVTRITGARAAAQETRNIISATGGRIKGTLSSIETLVSPKKLPESVVSDIFHTLKVPLKEFDSLEDAFKWRADLIKTASKSGNALVAEVGDSVITIKRNPLMRELGGGLAHATPNSKAFVGGTIVEYKKGMPLIEQGLFVSPEIAMRFAGTSAFGKVGNVKGTRPAIYIASPELAEKAIVDTKIYNKALEAEGKFQIGVELPAPKQILYTRMGDTGIRVDLLLTKPLTKKQIAKLKLEGLLEQIKNLYEPSITITSKTGKPLTVREINLLADIIGETDKGLARNIRTIASEPEGLARVYQRLQNPTAYRVINVTREGSPTRVSITKASRRIGETNRAYITRIMTENRTGRIPRADVSIITRQIRQADRQRIDASRITISARRTDTDRERPRTPREPIRSRTITIPRTARVKYEKLPRRPAPLPRGEDVPIRLTDGRTIHLTEEQLKSSYAWKQGLFYKLWYPPYKQSNLVTTKEKPPYVKMLEGEESAYRTLTMKDRSADVVQTPIAQMGIATIQVVKRGKKPMLVFKRSKKAKSRTSKLGISLGR